MIKICYKSQQPDEDLDIRMPVTFLSIFILKTQIPLILSMFIMWVINTLEKLGNADKDGFLYTGFSWFIVYEQYAT